jgi:DNA-binding transcriptional MerR regulator
MPQLSDYAKLTPFTLDELVGAVNSVLRNRPRLQIQGRTIRYYISKGVLPPPGGGPKFARYELEHLLGAVAIRCLQDQGMDLDEAAKQVRQVISQPDAAEIVQPWVDHKAPRALVIQERHAAFPAHPMDSRRVTRLFLSPELTLEFSEELRERDALEQARAAIELALKNLI